MKDKVVFKKFEDGEIIALFPDLPWNDKGDIASYMHIGQYGGASPELLIDLESATEDEYKYLANELKMIGYDI